MAAMDVRLPMRIEKKLSSGTVHEFALKLASIHYIMAWLTKMPYINILPVTDARMHSQMVTTRFFSVL